MRWTNSSSHERVRLRAFPARGELGDLLLELSTLWATARFGIVHDENKLSADAKSAKSNLGGRERARKARATMTTRLPRRTTMAVAALVLLVIASGGPARGDLTITIDQVGSDVTITGAGTLDLAGSQLHIPNYLLPPSILPSNAHLVVGAVNPAYADLYQGLLGPSSFGSGVFLPLPDEGAGSPIGVNGSGGWFVVPACYVSGATQFATNIYSSQILASLGLTPGVYIFPIPHDITTVQIGPAVPGVPEPSTAIVAAIGAVAFIAYGWSRHRREQRRQAAA